MKFKILFDFSKFFFLCGSVVGFSMLPFDLTFDFDFVTLTLHVGVVTDVNGDEDLYFKGNLARSKTYIAETHTFIDAKINADADDDIEVEMVTSAKRGVHVTASRSPFDQKYF